MSSDAARQRVEADRSKSDVRELRTAGGLRSSVADDAWMNVGVVAFTSGDIFKGHRLRSLIVRTRSACVFRAHHARLKSQVALKLFGAARPDDVRAVIARASVWATAGLAHPNVATIIEAGEYLRAPYVVSELVVGSTLSRYVGVSIPIAQALRWLLDVAVGLDATHRLGLVHGDVRASKVVVTTTGAKILAFGPSSTKHLAPEQQRATPVTNARTDQFGWGTLAWELLLSVLPRDARRGEMPVTGLPASLEAIIGRAIVSAPDDRFASMRDVASALEPLLACYEADDRARLESVAPPKASLGRTVASTMPPASPESMIAPPSTSSEPRALRVPERQLVDQLAGAVHSDVRRAIGASFREAAIVVALDVLGTKGRYSIQLAATDDAGGLHLPKVSEETLAVVAHLVGSDFRSGNARWRHLSFRIGPCGLDITTPIDVRA